MNVIRMDHTCVRPRKHLHAQWRFSIFDCLPFVKRFHRSLVWVLLCCIHACLPYRQYRELIESIEWVKNAFDNIGHTVEPMKNYIIFIPEKNHTNRKMKQSTHKHTKKESTQIISRTQLTDYYEFDWEREQHSVRRVKEKWMERKKMHVETVKLVRFL